MLTTAELTAMRSVQALTFDLTAVIKRGAGSSDGAGGTTGGSPTTVATVACRLAPTTVGDSEAIIAASIQGRQVWNITVPQGTDIQTTDYVEVGSRTFEVIAVYGAKTNETARVAQCVER